MVKCDPSGWKMGSCLPFPACPPFLSLSCTAQHKEASCSLSSLFFNHSAIGWAGWAQFFKLLILKNQPWMTSVYLPTDVAPLHKPWPSLQGCAVRTPFILYLVLEIHKKVNFFIPIFGLNKKSFNFFNFVISIYVMNEKLQCLIWLLYSDTFLIYLQY